MAAPLFKNLNPTERLPKGSVVRMAFQQEHGAVARSNTFAADFNSFWPKLFNVGGMAFPITPNPAIKGETVAVVDLRMSVEAPVSALVRAVDGISGYWIEISSLEKLTERQAQRAASNTGAAEREATKAEEYKQQENEGVLNKLAKGAGQALTTVKWAVVIVAVLLVFMYGGQIAKALPGKK